MFLRCFAAALLMVYIGWNIVWWMQLRLAPSIFESITGLPCATTGGTRSLLALVDGDWRESLIHNPMTLPILAVLLVSILVLVQRLFCGQRFVLPPRLFGTWVVVLSFAWVFKIVQWLLGQQI